MEHIVALPQYDVLAYLIAGIAAIAVCELIFGSPTYLRGDWGLKRVTIIIIVGYIAGHIIAVFSTWLVEDNVVRRAMGQPIEHLMEPNCRPASEQSCLQKMIKFSYDNLPFSGYFAPLECNTQKRILERARQAGRRDITRGELFWEAYNTTKQDKDAFDRIVTFHQEYNFCRNLCFVAFLAAISVIFQRNQGKPPWKAIMIRYELPKWAQYRLILSVAFLLVGAVLFARYLYFYRAHSIEVLTSYAYGADIGK